MIQQVKDDPFLPAWTANNKGMAGLDTLNPVDRFNAGVRSLKHRDAAIELVEDLKTDYNIAKQDANRYLEPWMTGPVLLTGTDGAWEWFFKLRCDRENVQPDFYRYAVHMRNLYRDSEVRSLDPGEWHIPYWDATLLNLDSELQLKVATARAARISYRHFDGGFDIEKDVALHDILIAQRHMTPLEHQARAMRVPSMYRNFSDFMHYRQMVEDKTGAMAC